MSTGGESLEQSESLSSLGGAWFVLSAIYVLLAILSNPTFSH